MTMHKVETQFPFPHTYISEYFEQIDPAQDAGIVDKWLELHRQYSATHYRNTMREQERIHYVQDPKTLGIQDWEVPDISPWRAPGSRDLEHQDLTNFDLGKILVQLLYRKGVIQNNENLRKELFTSKSHEDVLEVLHKKNLDHCAHEYLSYLERRQDNLEEGESPGIILHSLQSWAWFLIDYAEPMKLPYADFYADFDGCVELEWRLSGETKENERADKYWGSDEGIAVLRFYPSRMNAFSVLSGPYASGKRRITFEGCLSYGKTKEILPLFAERFLDDND